MLVILFFHFAVALFTRDSIPDSFDWRSKGVITPVHNQGYMDDPVALAVSDAMFAFGNITTSKQIVPSLEEIVDCCGSRLASNYFDCISQFGGVCSVEDYPYPKPQGTCNSDNCQAKIMLTSSGTVQKGNETSLLEALLQVPVVVYINVNMAMEEYTGGIFNDPSCSPEGINHGMLLVGYTSEYWILKNTWGVNWGESGYINLIRGKNMCGVAEFGTYPSLL